MRNLRQHRPASAPIWTPWPRSPMRASPWTRRRLLARFDEGRDWLRNRYAGRAGDRASWTPSNLIGR